MTDIFQIVGVGMVDSRQRLEAISSNAAGASLPGYRRHVVPGGAFDTVFAAKSSLSPPGESAGVAAAALAPVRSDMGSRVSSQVNLQSASSIATGRALDLAIDGDELFFALTDGTQSWLTRAGSFQLSADGTLVAERGLQVLGTQGAVHLPASEVEIAEDGRILHQGAVVARLQLFRSNDPAALRAAQGSLLTSPAGMQPAATGEGRVRSGQLEASNTDAAREMLGLIAVSRQFEALSRVVQGYDEMLGRTLEKLGGG